MERIENDHISDKKIYKDTVIYGVAYVGGPLAAGYIIAENFKAFGDNANFKKTWVITLIFTVLLFGAVIFIPGADKIPKYIIPLSYTIIAYWIIRRYQGKQIEEHVKNGGKLYSAWRSVLVSLISLLITFSLILLLIFLQPDAKAEIEIYTYKGMNNEITYYPANIEKDEIVFICQKLETVNHFDSTYAMALFIDKVSKTYKIYVPYSTPSWDNPGDIGFYENARKQMRSYYPKNGIEFILCDSAYNPKRTIK